MTKAEEQPRSRLGRGLAALIGDAGAHSAPSEGAQAAQRRVPIASLRSNPRNPRRHFDDDELQDLANSIRERGVIQPIIARATSRNAATYEIVAGERRWQAAQRAGLHDVPVVIIEAGDKEALEIAIIENVQRADLNPLEEAQGYERLIAEFGYSQNEMARVIGKSRSHVANTLRLLKLPDAVKVSLAAGDISAGHARSLLAVADPDAVAKQILAHGLTVRDVERIAQNEQVLGDNAGARAALSGTAAARSADIRGLEKMLGEALGLVVTLTPRRQGGDLRIRYKTVEQLDGVCARLRG